MQVSRAYNGIIYLTRAIKRKTLRGKNFSRGKYKKQKGKNANWISSSRKQ